VKKLLAVMAMIVLLTIPALAADVPDAETTPAVDTSELEEALPEQAKEILGDVTVSDGTEGTNLLEKVKDWALQNVGQKVKQAAGSALTALAVALLCSVAGAAAPDGKTPEYVILGGALAITASCAGSVSSYLAEAKDALTSMSDFSKALLPCIASASAVSGHAVSGAARYAASSLFMDILLTLGTSVVLPLIYAYVAAASANAALPGGVLGGAAKLIKWVCGTVLAVLTTVFTVYLSLSGAVTGSADAVAKGLAKSAISAALPVVGSIIADAADTYLAGAQLLRGAVGVLGLVAVLCVCVGPFLGLGIHYLFFKAAACIVEPFAEGRLSALLGDIGGAYGMALGLVGSAGLMLFISVVLGTQILSG